MSKRKRAQTIKKTASLVGIAGTGLVVFASFRAMNERLDHIEKRMQKLSKKLYLHETYIDDLSDEVCGERPFVQENEA